MAIPCPHASTYGSSAASTATDSFVIFQFQVEIYGGPETRFLFSSKSHRELMFTVKIASPAIPPRGIDQGP